MRTRLKSVLEPSFTGFQWVSWKWAVTLGNKAGGNLGNPLAITGAIIANEVGSTQTYGHILKKLEAKETKNIPIPETNNLWKITLSNMTAGITFYFVDSAITNASQNNALQLFFRCTGVFFGDSIAHFSTGKLYDKFKKTTENISLDNLRSAYEVGVLAVAYDLGDQLATYTSDSCNIQDQSTKNALSSLFIFSATTVALPLSRALWSLPRRFFTQAPTVPIAAQSPAPTADQKNGIELSSIKIDH